MSSTKETALDTPNVMQRVRGACARFCEARGLEASDVQLLTMTALGRSDAAIAAELSLDEAGLATAKANFQTAAKASLAEAVEAATNDALAQLKA